MDIESHSYVGFGIDDPPEDPMAAFLLDIYHSFVPAGIAEKVANNEAIEKELLDLNPAGLSQEEKINKMFETMIGMKNDMQQTDGLTRSHSSSPTTTGCITLLT